MFTWKRLLLASAGLIILLLLFVTLILPGILVSKAQDWVATTTGRSLVVGSLSINPLTLVVEARDVSLSERDHAIPFVSWQLLRVALSPRSLLKWAPMLRELRLDRPIVHLERRTAETFNFSDLIPARDKTAAPQSTDEPLRFAISNLSINQGRIDLVDNSLPEPVHHTINDLQLVLPVIGNLPYLVDEPAQPLFHAVVNGSPINFEGELKPFSTVQELRFEVNLANIDLPFYLGYVPIELPVELRHGGLGANLVILYRVSAESGAELEMSGRFDMTSLDIRDRSNQQLFLLPLLQVEIAPSQLLQKELHLSAIRLLNPEVHLKRDAQGQINLASLAAPSGGNAKAVAQEPPAKPFDLRVDHWRVGDGVIFFEDDFPGGGFTTVARDVNIDVRNFALDAGSGIPIELTLATDRGEAAAVSGQFLIKPLTLNLDIKLNDIDASAYQPYYQATYNGPLGGKIDVGLNLAVRPGQTLLVSDGRLQWHEGAMAFNEREGIKFDLADLAGLNFDLDRNRLEVASLTYQNGRINFSRNQAGQWSFLSRNFPILAKLTEAPPQPAATDQTPKGSPFSYRIGKLSIIGSTFEVTDHLPTQPVNFEIRDFNLTFHDLAAPEKVESPFTLSTAFQGKGRIEVSGTASLAAQSIQFNSQLHQIPLQTFAPYLADRANLELVDGLLEARLQTNLAAAAGDLQMSLAGDVGINRFQLLDGLHRQDLLTWDNLQVAGIDVRSAPLAVQVKSITLSDYFAKVLIDEQARLNLAEALKKPGTAQSIEPASPEQQAAPAKPEQQATPATPSQQSPRDIHIDTVVLQGGRVDFTDRHLLRPFHADMRQLGGRIQGLSSAAESRAEVDLRGSLRNQSPLTISGVVNPLAEKIFLDLKLSFTDIDLNPLSPYSSTYVGYMIKKGKLNLALEYHLENGKLKADNKVFLDQFTFGDKVKSEKATSLPVKLAVALLKDSNGEIHLDIPVSGNLDDPKFSVVGVVWTVIRNLLVKAATSPIALLGAVFGGGEQDFSSVSFGYGLSSLAADQKDKLRKMAKALAARPGLDVEVSGFVDPDKDPEGYRKEHLIMQVKHLKYLDLRKAGKLPEGTREKDVTVSAKEYPDYLWAVYQNADFPKPRNFIGMTTKLPVPEMEKLIYTNTSVTEQDLADLAQARAEAVQSFLTESEKLAPDRIFLQEADITSAPKREGETRARVEFGITAR